MKIAGARRAAVEEKIDQGEVGDEGAMELRVDGVGHVVELQDDFVGGEKGFVEISPGRVSREV